MALPEGSRIACNPIVGITSLGDLNSVHVAPLAENGVEWNAIGPVPLNRPLERLRIVLEGCGSDVPYEWHVEEVKPECGLIAFVGMTMPALGWGQDNITGRHIDPPSVYPV